MYLSLLVRLGISQQPHNNLTATSQQPHSDLTATSQRPQLLTLAFSSFFLLFGKGSLHVKPSNCYLYLQDALQTRGESRGVAEISQQSSLVQEGCWEFADASTAGLYGDGRFLA